MYSEKLLRSSIFLLAIPIVLSSFTHIWNPIGFPSVYIDEDAYMQRAMIVLEGDGPRDKSFPYDHPYFGQLFLAAVFKIINYPNSIIPLAVNGDLHSIEMLYLVPRMLMGILAVIDTFLVYKIAERRYNRNVALIASVLFAVMPMTWLLRRILLDNILMPFLLSSILFALYAKSGVNNNNGSRGNLTVLLSGIFLGLAIFTKVPAFTMIPLVAFLLVYRTGAKNGNGNGTHASNSGRRLGLFGFNKKNMKMLGLWLIPVILIPSIWPLHAISLGEFDHWLKGIYYQTHRDPVKEHVQVFGIGSVIDEIIVLLQIDPVLLVIGFIGVFYTVLRRDLFLSLWVIPFLFFLYREGFAQYFYYILLLPAFCIGSARLIEYLSKRITISYNRTVNRILLPLLIVLGIGIFGLVNTTLLITTTLNSSYFDALAFADKYVSDNNNNRINGHSNNYENNLTIISDFRYSWILQHVLHKNYDYKRFWDIDPVNTARVIMIFQDDFLNTFLTNEFNVGKENLRGETVYNKTFQIATFAGNGRGAYNSYLYPYNNMRLNALPQKIEIRTNVLTLNSFGFVIPISQNGPKVTKINHALEISVPPNQVTLPSYWNDSYRNCEHVFKCNISLTSGWRDNISNNDDNNDKASFQVSTSSTNNKTWSWIYGKEIIVKPLEQYQLVTHMKLNKFVIGSHIAVEGYNNKTKQWEKNNQIIQCPSGINGPLEWKQFKCNITIPKDITKIRLILNAGWSSQPGKEAVTQFDDIYALNNKTTNMLVSSHNLVSNSDFVYFDDFVKIISLCQLRGDFDVQIDYRLVGWPQSNGVGLSLIAKESDNNELHDALLKSVERVSMGSGMNLRLNATELYRTRFNDDIHQINATSQINNKPANDTLGKLRLERSGSKVIGYYYNSGSWIPIHSNVGTIPSDINIVLRAGAGQYGLMHQPVKIDLLDYIINKGQLVNCQNR